MIGDHLSQEAHRKLKLWGTVAILGFYILCVVQARQWPIYSVVCGPVTMVTWIWGLGAYKRPRETGRIANFGTPCGMPLGRLTEIAGVPTGFQRGQLAQLEGRVLRPDPGGEAIKFDAVKTIKLSRPVTPPIRVSRYKRVSDPTLWVL